MIFTALASGSTDMRRYEMNGRADDGALCGIEVQITISTRYFNSALCSLVGGNEAREPTSKQRQIKRLQMEIEIQRTSRYD